MEISILIARIVSLLYLVIGVSLLINPDYYRRMIADFRDHPGLTYLTGIVVLILGFLIVSYHNIWTASWVVIITILGWLALIKGIALLLVPNHLMRMSEALIKRKNLIIVEGLFAIILGLVLGYFGFVA